MAYLSSRAKRPTDHCDKLVHPIARESSGVNHVVIVVAKEIGSIGDVILQ